MKILYFSPIMWGDLKQRPQHINEELSHYFEITFIEPSISAVSSLLKGNKNYSKSDQKINENLSVFRAAGYRLPKIFEIIDLFKLNLIYEKMQLKEYLSQADMIWLGSPLFYPLIKSTNKPVIYDKMDDFSFLTKNAIMKHLIRKYELEVYKKATLVFSSSDALVEEAKIYNSNVYLIENGIDIKMLQISQPNNIVSDINKMKQSGFKIFVYVGTVDHWFDFEAVQKILDHDNKNHVIIIGRNNVPQSLQSERLFYYGTIPKTEISAVLLVSDVCLYPFKLDSNLDTINPVKIYEYLSMNKKVIAAESRETLKMESLMRYKNYRELDNILDNIDDKRLPFDTQLLQRFIKVNSWEYRVEKIMQIVNSHQLVK